MPCRQLLWFDEEDGKSPKGSNVEALSESMWPSQHPAPLEECPSTLRDFFPSDNLTLTSPGKQR